MWSFFCKHLLQRPLHLTHGMVKTASTKPHKAQGMSPVAEWLVHKTATRGCSQFPEFVQNYSERHIVWSLCSVDFHTFTLQLPIQLYILWRLNWKFLWVHLKTIKISAKRAQPRSLLFEYLNLASCVYWITHGTVVGCLAGCEEAESQGTCVTYISAKCE